MSDDIGLAIGEQLAAIRVDLAEMRQTAAARDAAADRRFVAIEAAVAEGEERQTALARAMTKAIADSLRQRRAGATGTKPVKPDDPAASYADPGYQPDKRPRYPLDTNEHIRAAWSYIHEGRDADKYSPREIEEIERRIIAAWRAKIDPDGPPEAEDEDSEDEARARRDPDTARRKPADPDKAGKPPAEARGQAVTRGRHGRTKPKPEGVLGWLVW